MLDLLSRADPAKNIPTDATSLRARVDEHIGGPLRLSPTPPRVGRPWLRAVAAFALVLAVFVPVAFVDRSANPSPLLQSAVPDDLVGVAATIDLQGGGVKTTAVDGDTIWVMNALQRRLDRIDVRSSRIESSHTIDGHVEGVVVGGGYVWLASYDNGGELLRFDPAVGAVDLSISTAGAPTMEWLGDSLWVSDEAGALGRVDSTGVIASAGSGQLKGAGLGYLWVNDLETGLISSLAADGTVGDIVIPTVAGAETADGPGVRQVIEIGGRVWLMDGMYPWGTNLSIFDPETGELSSFGGLTFGLTSMASFEGSLWVTSGTDQVVFRIDPETELIRRYALPGKPGSLLAAGGGLWATFFQPGALVQIDPDTLIEAGPIVADDWDGYPHRLLCTGDSTSAAPTIVLEPFDWIDYGSWSVVQAELSSRGYTVCANGYVEGDFTPQQRADDLAAALIKSGFEGPYVMVGAGDGAHTIRIFANGREDVAGVVLVDPVPVGFQEFYDQILPELRGHPPWADIDIDVSQGLGDLGGVPLVVIGQDPERTFLNPDFRREAGDEVARLVNETWQDGLDFYERLSSDATRVTAVDSGLDMIMWEHPDLIVEQVLDVLERISGS